MADARSFRERLRWDGSSGELRDGAIRYMLIRPDALMGIFAGLEATERARALDAFRQSIATFGARSAASYRADDDHPLIETVADTAPDLGWGRWSVDRTDDGIRVSVQNSPFVAGAGATDAPVCAPILGMLDAVGRLMGRSGRTHEISCAAVSGDCCIFEMMA